MTDYDVLPERAALKTQKFSVSIPENKLQEFNQLLRLSPLGPTTFENSQTDQRLGLSYEWMADAKSYWETRFDWRAHEKKINSFPHYTTTVKDGKDEYTVHFVSLFSQKEDAIPVMCIHGWPGSFLEYLGVLKIFKEKYSPQLLPYHIIVPSLPGFAFSSKPPVYKDWGIEHSGRLLHGLMVGLGFGGGYTVQGTDIGTFAARYMVAKYEACKAMHLNNCLMHRPKNADGSTIILDKAEEEGVAQGENFARTSAAYALEHATRPATIGFVLSSSPLAVLAWIGEKFLAWTDKTPHLDQILECITLYWLTSTFPSSIYSYRGSFKNPPNRYNIHEDPAFYCHKPLGYSIFPKDNYPIPKAWLATTGNLVWSRAHESGGHFPSMESPAAIAQDIEDFLVQVWKL